MATESPKKLAMEEVAKHKTKDSLWIVVDDRVFDITKFIHEHPGGEEVLLENAGADATEQFEDVGHSTDARKLRDSFLIGELQDSDKKNKGKKGVHSIDPKERAAAAQESGGSGLVKLLLLAGLGAAVAAGVYYYKAMLFK